MRLLGTAALSFRRAPLRWAATAWLAAMAVLLFRAYWQGPARQSVYPAYADAGRHWLAGTDAYEVERDANGRLKPKMADYRYAPAVSVFFVPFGLLPDSLGAIVWRVLSYLVYLAALIWFLRAVAPSGETVGPLHFAAFALLVLPLSLPSMNNGQANVLVIALLMAGVAACAQERWNVASLCLAGAFFLKLYPLAIALLLVVVYPRQLGWRLLLTVWAGFLLPFALQRTDYVSGQYQTWFFLLGADDRRDFDMTLGYRDFWLLTRYLGFALPRGLYACVQLAAAAAIAGLCLAASLRSRPRKEVLMGLFVLGCCWMIVFGPATESCTFILLAPALAWSLLDAFCTPRPVWVRGLLAAVFGMLVLSFASCWFRESRNWFYLFQPLTALIFMIERFLFFARRNEVPPPTVSQEPRLLKVRVESCVLQKC